MEYKRFASKGSDNPFSDVSMKRSQRMYPPKRNTWGSKKKKEVAKKMK